MFEAHLKKIIGGSGKIHLGPDCMLPSCKNSGEPAGSLRIYDGMVKLRWLILGPPLFKGGMRCPKISKKGNVRFSIKMGSK